MSAFDHTTYPLGSHAGHVLFVEQTFGAGQTLPWHEHSNAYVSLVASGTYREVYSSGSLLFTSGTAVFHPAGESHRDDFGTGGGRVFSLNFTESFIEDTAGRAVPHGPLRAFPDGPVPFLLHSLARAVRGSRPARRATADELVMELIGHLADPGSATGAIPPRWLPSALALIRSAFRGPMGLGEVSRAVGVHPAHVAREFRRHVRASVGEYVRSLRIAWACEELARGGVPLARLAIEAGFFDQAHFCRAFQRECGVPPSRFRRCVRAERAMPGAH